MWTLELSRQIDRRGKLRARHDGDSKISNAAISNGIQQSFADIPIDFSVDDDE